MPGRGMLSGGAPRLLGCHNGARGKAYRRAYNALAAEFQLASPLARLEAGRVAVAWTNLVAATEALEVGRMARETGKGRKPGAKEIERLARRQGLADTSYATALDKLRELISAHRK